MVKFIVNVKLMENRVKSHVGSVIVVKVINQNNRPGMTLSRRKTHRPNAARMEELASPLRGVGAAASSAGEAVADGMAGFKICDKVFKLAVTEGKASTASMVDVSPYIRPHSTADWSASCHTAVQWRV